MTDADFIDDSEDETYTNARKHNRRSLAKRRKINNGGAVKVENQDPKSFIFLQPLLDVVESYASENDEKDGQRNECPFESAMNNLLPEYLQERKRMLNKEVELDIYGQPVQPLTRSEVSSWIQDLSSRARQGPLTTPQAIVLRKLKLQRERRLARVPEPCLSSTRNPATPLTPLPLSRSSHVNPVVIDALYSIKTTPYRNSFASRLYGMNGEYTDGRNVLAIDWETRSPWMELMVDVRDHYSLAHPDREQPKEQQAPIIYGSLLLCHLPQVHDLLARIFWAGIDVTDSLQFSPEKCTVIVTYKRLVVGVAIMSSPQETYITYLAVRAGWENSQIATSMLYHLIQLNPNKDITLHVSANNPAMLLYNRFGFKAEEFVVGFYEDYLDPQSRASKNAFRLRLRR